MTVDAFRAMSTADLEKRLGEARQELFNLRFQHATGALENTSRLREARREIARLLTVQNEQTQEGGDR